MKQYVDLKFYKEIFKGTLFNDESVFDRLVMEASFYVDQHTLGRIGDNPTDEVKMATCKVTEILQCEFIQQNEDQIASESVGPHSISYVKNNVKTQEEFEKEKQKAIRMYLARTGLLYRGVAR